MPIGEDFARALAAKDYGRVRELLHPDVDFRGMTPRRTWEAADVDVLVAEVLDVWFAESDVIEAIEQVDTDAFADRERVGYRFRGHNPEGPFVVEQQAYLAERDGRIAWLRILCSGFRPAE